MQWHITLKKRKIFQIDPILESRIWGGRSLIKMFDLKTKYRKWTGGGHKIHATNNTQETNHDITLLLGINYNDYLSIAIRSWDNEIKQVKRNLSGTETWKNLEA